MVVLCSNHSIQKLPENKGVRIAIVFFEIFKKIP
jgi:hypothetical protein